MDVIERWREIAHARDVKALADLLAEDVVFRSPIVHAPQRGKAITLKYLAAAFDVLLRPDFAYVGEWRGENSAVLEFTTTIEGIEINGVDIITWDASGRIVEFKVMARPLKGINLLHHMMGERLAGQTAANA
ncbi:MAG: nuclear transport factor 2 family protein [Pseudomonadota bacterium]|nr:nuclear transport factor 2 family protein [Pseudomonadota bacterium]